MKQLLVATVFLFSLPTMGCTLGYVDYEPVFSNGRSDLSASEVMRLASWRAQLRLWLPSGGKYLVYARQNARVGVSAKLAEQRRKNLLSTLSNMGIDKVDIESRRRFAAWFALHLPAHACIQLQLPVAVGQLVCCGL